MSIFGPDSAWYRNKYGDPRTAPRKSAVFPDVRLQRELLGGLRSGFGEQVRGAVLPGLTSAIARQSMMRGGSLPFASDIPASADTLSLLASSDYADLLMGLRTGISGALQGIPSAGSARSDILGGAAQGFVAGGPFGAIAGAAGGALNSGSKKQARSDALKHADRAIEFASPERTAQIFEEELPLARETALASGEGQRRAQAIESAISASGLRGTGLGALASVAAGVQTELAGLEQAIATTRDIQQRQVSSVIGTPVKESRDPLARALEGLASDVATGSLTRSRPTAATRVPENQGFESAPLFPGSYEAPMERAGANI